MSHHGPDGPVSNPVEEALWTPEVGDRVEVPNPDGETMADQMVPGTIVSVDGAYFAVRFDGGETSPINWVPDDGVQLIAKGKTLHPEQRRFLVVYSDSQPFDQDRMKGYSAWATSAADAIASRQITADTIYVFEYEKEGLTFRASREYVLEPRAYGSENGVEVKRPSGPLGEDGAEVLGL